jgi:hypothetical protein
MKKNYLIFFIILIIIVAGIFFWLRLSKEREDSWIKDSRGVYIKHGDPSEIPDYVLEQEELISCAKNLYEQNKFLMNFSSQCLGVCGDYAVDIVHVPRNDEDNLPENQCEVYRKKEVIHFIELDKNGEIVRIV